MGWTYKDFTKVILGLTGIDLSSYKERQMKRRIDSLVSRNGYNKYEDYYYLISKNREKFHEFVNYITINVSEFYRNPKQWEIMEREILPVLFNKHKNIKVWSAACSTGEEPYSLVMLLTKFIPLSTIRVLATDIDRDAIDKARNGVYKRKSLEHLPKEFKKKYFKQKNDRLIMDSRIISRVKFRHHDLLQDSFPKSCHLILCRNVMIYFTEEAKSKLYYKFQEALHPDGVLFVGNTEQIILPKRYHLQPMKTFFYKKV